MSNVYTKDVGTLIQLDTGEDLSEVIDEKIYFKAPDESTGALGGITVVEDTKLQHIKTALTFNQAGTWYLQAYAQWNAGDIYHGDIVQVTVVEGLS